MTERWRFYRFCLERARAWRKRDLPPAQDYYWSPQFAAGQVNYWLAAAMGARQAVLNAAKLQGEKR